MTQDPHVPGPASDSWESKGPRGLAASFENRRHVDDGDPIPETLQFHEIK